MGGNGSLRDTFEGVQLILASWLSLFPVSTACEEVEPQLSNPTIM